MRAAHVACGSCSTTIAWVAMERRLSASTPRAPREVQSRAMGSGLEDRFQTLHEIVKAARGCLPQGPWDYLTGGAETETTVRRNRQALDSVAFRPRVLRNVSSVDLTTTFLGRPLRLP